ncbi:MAG: T9SS type A sorting domain-containing protein [Ignavibacteria bacterium]|nr:T9SS type A sorting domain-containing protein [Ignavibacteria bacterium]
MKKILLMTIFVLTANAFSQPEAFDNLLFRFKCNTIDSIAYNQGGGVDIGTKIATLGDWNGDVKDEFLLISCREYLSPHGYMIDGYRYMIFEGGNPPPPMPKYHWFVNNGGNTNNAETDPIIYDFNKDGYLDICKLRMYYNLIDTMDIFYGGPDFDTIPDLSLPTPGRHVNNSQQLHFYGTTINFGDFNGDGTKEMMLSSFLNPFAGGGKYGFLLFLPLTVPFSTVQYYLGLPDTLTRREGFGSQILTSGDINGDGYTDVLMQTDTLNANNNISYTKRLGAKLIFGNPQYSLDNYVFFSEDTMYASNMRIIPDINGDGMAELMWTKDFPDSYVQISFGKRGSGHVLTRDVSFWLTGTALKTPKLLGDINNDGYNDLGFVSYTLTGGSLVLLGGPTPVIGRRYTDSYHRHMGQVGDINGDGVDDFAAGEFHGNGGGNACQRLEWGQPLYYMVWSGDTTAINPSGIEDEPLPEGYNIEINPYPNPFNPEVKVEYILPESGEVNLSVYSPLGEEIVKKNLSYRNKGKNETTLDFSGLNVPSGVYLLRLTLQTQDKGTMVKTTKLVFMK